MPQENRPCEKCGIGYLRPTGYALLSNPPQYPHVCTHCHHEQVLRSYPHTYDGTPLNGTPLTTAKRHGFWEVSPDLRCYMVATDTYWFIRFSDNLVTTEHADVSVEENWYSAVQVLLSKYTGARLLAEDEI